jgi:hypothetical protein
MTDYNDDSRALMQRFNVVGPPTRRIRVASQSVFSQSVLKWEKSEASSDAVGADDIRF